MMIFRHTPVLIKGDPKIVYFLVDAQAQIGVSAVGAMRWLVDRYGKRVMASEKLLTLAFPAGLEVTIVSTLNNALLKDEDIGKRVKLTQPLYCWEPTSADNDDACMADVEELGDNLHYIVLSWNIVRDDEVDPSVDVDKPETKPVTFENLRALDQLKDYPDTVIGYIAWLIESSYKKTASLFNTIYDEVLKMPQIYRSEAYTGYPATQIGFHRDSDVGFRSVQSGKVFIVKLAPAKIYTYEVRSLDVWGNEEEGFEVNNSFRAGKIEIHENTTDEEIIQQLIDEGYIRSHAKDLVELESGGDVYLITVQDKTTTEPLYNLIREE